MEKELLLRGIVLGFAIAAPVGPIGVLCIRRTLAEGGIVGVVSGLGAATADAIYGCIAGFGLTVIANVLVHQKAWLGLIGGIFLCYLGIKTLLSKPAEQAASTIAANLIQAYASTLLLTLANPMTILAFAAMFAGLGLSSTPKNHLSAVVLVLGVFIGSALWWVCLSSSVSLLRQRFNLDGLRWVNRISGIIIIVFGVLALLSLIQAQ
ncbi:LysE family translocator [Pantanalinema rosaneae CENA516]|uniref:LysE family translocator n=1 Tax=Pantanalinema rosaneae TaxID=1620701 RepID=UPI003D6E1A11